MRKYLLFLLLLTSCTSDQVKKFTEDQTPQKRETFQVLSIRVDDDGEFHLVLSSPSFGVQTFSDLNSSYEIRVYYDGGKEAVADVLLKSYSEGRWTVAPYPVIVHLPANYKIETFDD